MRPAPDAYVFALATPLHPLLAARAVGARALAYRVASVNPLQATGHCLRRRFRPASSRSAAAGAPSGRSQARVNVRIAARSTGPVRRDVDLAPLGALRAEEGAGGQRLDPAQ